MPVDKLIVERKLSALREWIRKINEVEVTGDEFLADTIIQDALVMRMIQAVEVATDIVTHVVSALELPRRDTVAEMIQELGTVNVLSEETVQAMINANSFRNMAVYEYDSEKFDLRRVYADRSGDIQSLRKFMIEIVEYLAKQKDA